MSGAKDVLRFDDLERYLMLRNGNVLYKVPFRGCRGGWAVLKLYYGSRSRLGYLYKSFVHVCFQNHTSLMPKARRKVESACLRLWRGCGIRVFDTYEDVRVEGLPEGGYTLFEYVDGTLFRDWFSDGSRPLDDKRAMWRRFVAEWERRHRLAIERCEPRLVHENGTLDHVMITGDELLYFDLEMAYRSRSRRRVRAFVAEEILSFLRSLGRCVSPGERDALLADTVACYGDRELLELAVRIGCRHPNPLRRIADHIDPLLKAPDKRPHARLYAARRLEGALRSRPSDGSPNRRS